MIHLYESNQKYDTLEEWFVDGLDQLPKKDWYCYARDVCLSMTDKDNNSPIILSAISFDTFSQYLAGLKPTKKRKKSKESIAI